MCGLVGVFGKLSVSHEELFETMLQLDVLRGPHSTGIAIVPMKKGAPTVVKGTFLPQELLNYTEYKKAKAGLNLLLMGHNRWATRGKVAPENAHPFKHGHITCAHNGTVSEFRFENYTNFETDSEAICHNISTIGIEETWKLVDGAATLTWWDSRYRTLNFISNGKRPFYFAYNITKDVLIWASEKWMISVAAERCKVKLATHKGTDENAAYTYFTPTANIHFAFSLNNGILKHTTKELKPYTVSYNIYNYENDGWAGHWPGRQHQNYGFKWREEKKENSPLQIIHNPAYQRNDMKPSLLEFRRKFTQCLFCETSLFDHYQDAKIISDLEAICPDCAKVAADNKIEIV